jgi:hypothetical protein
MSRTMIDWQEMLVARQGSGKGEEGWKTCVRVSVLESRGQTLIFPWLLPQKDACAAEEAAVSRSGTRLQGCGKAFPKPDL